MSNYVSRITIHNTTYDLKDKEAREAQETLEENLGELAYKDNATGNIVPSGTVSAPEISVVPATSTIKNVNSVGSLPSWSASVNNETLSFDFDGGTLPTTEDKTVVTGISSASASSPVFSGSEQTISVS